jgi:hypothetical protein
MIFQFWGWTRVGRDKKTVDMYPGIVLDCYRQGGTGIELPCMQRGAGFTVKI